MSWQTRILYHFKRMLAKHANDGFTGDSLIALIDASYPFRSRSGHAYKVWRYEMKLLQRTLAGDHVVTGTILRDCPACGARPGEGCLNMDARRGEVFRPTLPAGQFHEMRERGFYQDVIAEEQSE